LKYILIAIVSYLLGSINAGIVISNLSFKKDIRKHGSGNAGATNMTRVFGALAGIGTLLGDMLKTVLAMLFGSWLCADVGICISGLMCLIGHCFPIYYKFKGGKGIAVGAVIAIMIDVRIFLIAITLFAVAVLLSKRVSLGSISAALTVLIGSIVFNVSTPKLILAIIGSALVLFAHRSNIKRLILGTEPKFSIGSK